MAYQKSLQEFFGGLLRVKCRYEIIFLLQRKQIFGGPKIPFSLSKPFVYEVPDDLLTCSLHRAPFPSDGQDRRAPHHVLSLFKCFRAHEDKLHRHGTEPTERPGNFPPLTLRRRIRRDHQ